MVALTPGELERNVWTIGGFKRPANRRSMKSTRRFLLLALAALVVGFIWWRRIAPATEASKPPGVTAPARVPEPTTVLVNPESVEAADPRATVAATQSEPTLVQKQDTAPTPSSHLAHVRGRCVAPGSGEPLAGCKVTLNGSPSNASALAVHGGIRWSAPNPAVTSADGRFDIEFEPPPAYQHFLNVQCAGRAPRTARWLVFEAGQVEDLGDVSLALGSTVEGRVVDPSGAAVPGVFVSLLRLPLPIRDDMFASDSLGGWSDSKGDFRLEDAVPAGTWSLDADAPGVKVVSPDGLTIPDAGSVPTVLVVVRRMTSISGVVVDETGTGVRGVWLQAEMTKRSGKMASARTSADGSFTIHAVDDALAPVRIECNDPGPCEPMAEPTIPYPWGTSEVRIELVRARSFELTVVERKSGAPVEEYSVTCFSVRATSSIPRDARLQGRHPGGKVTVDRVWRGRNSLTVHPKDPELFANLPISFEAADAPLAPIRIELDRAVKRSVRVVDGSREPLAGSLVELVRIGSEPFEPGSWVIDHKKGGQDWSTDDEDRPHVLLAEATTDERGLASLPVPPVGEGLGLRATGTRHLATVMSPIRFSEDGGVTEIVVSPGGRVAGVLRVAGYSPGTVFLEFIREPSGGEFEPPRVEVGSDGTFESPRLGPGSWTLHLLLDVAWREERSEGRLRRRLQPELARTLVAEGQTTRVELDGREFNAGQVSGTILMDGAPLPECRVFLTHNGEFGARFGQYVPDAAGRFEAKGLPPGTWTPGIVVGDFRASEGDRLDSEKSFALGPGESVRNTFSFERRRLVLRVLQPDGATPLASAEVLIELISQSGFDVRTTDADGRLVLDPAPAGAFRLLDGELASDEFRMPAGRMEAELTAVLRKP